MRMKLILVATTVAFSAVGCSDAMDAEVGGYVDGEFGRGPAGAEGSPPAETQPGIGYQDKIFGAGISQSYSAVQIITEHALCSAVLLNNHILLTAAHCVQPKGRLTPNGNVKWKTTIYSYAPEGSINVVRDVFYYQHPDYDPAEASADRYNNDIAVGGISESLGLNSRHFATLLREQDPVNYNMTLRGYGQPDYYSSKMRLKTTATNGLRVDWTTLNDSRRACRGDSGGPISLSSHHVTNNGFPFWPAVAAIHAGSVVPDADNMVCGVGGLDGYATLTEPKFEFIRDILEFWPNDPDNKFVFKNFTNNVGDLVSYGWTAP